MKKEIRCVYHNSLNNCIFVGIFKTINDSGKSNNSGDAGIQRRENFASNVCRNTF